MPETSSGKIFCAGFFGSVELAEKAIENLRAAGFSKEEIVIICPQEFQSRFHADVAKAERPGSGAAKAVAEGSAVGATLGGIALVTAIATGGAGLLPALPILVGGGAIAGGFSGLIAADGYGKGVGELYGQAVHFRKIVVGVELDGGDAETRLAKALQILFESGAERLTPETS